MAKLRKLNDNEMNESRKRFMKLTEYSFVNREDDLLLDEDDDNPSELEQPNDEQPNLNQTDNNQDIEQNSTDNMSQQPIQPETPNVDPTQPIDQNVQNVDMTQEPKTDDNNTGEVEIDITDLTDKQSEIERNVEAMSSQTTKLMDMVSQLADKVQNVIQNTDSEMKKVKDELIKRNPTPVEVLQKRITVSDPFNQTPKDYWDKKEAEGHYKLSDDDNELELRGSDINGSASEIYKSFGVDDDDWNQSLSSMFRI